MTFFEQLQDKLRKDDSKIDLKLEIYASPPDSSIIIHKANRTFFIKKQQNKWGIILKEGNYYQAKGKFKSVETICNVLIQWLEKSAQVESLHQTYKTLKIYTDINFTQFKYAKNKKNWNKLNNFFWGEEYFYAGFGFEKNIKIIQKILKDEILNKTYPFSSLGRICILNDKDKFNYLCISANRFPEHRERFFVNIPPNSEQLYFNEISKALIELKNNLQMLPK